MDFDAVLEKVLALLQREKRVSYRALKLRFSINDEYIEALKEELIDAKELAIDKDGKVLVWVGDRENPTAPTSAPAQPQPPASYTPPHLAERILAEQAAMESRGSADGERKTIVPMDRVHHQLQSRVDDGTCFLRVETFNEGC